MRLFHVSDVLTVTTGRLLSNRHMSGVYDILNFLTGDSLFTHQLPRAMRECEPWLRAQFPGLFPEAPEIAALLEKMDARLETDRDGAIRQFVSGVQRLRSLPEQIPVYEMGEGMRTHIDPLEEARAMVGDERVVVVNVPEPDDAE